MDKCCNKFKELMGNPGDPKRVMILRCQWIQQRILKTSAPVLCVLILMGDAGLGLSEDSLEREEDNMAEGEDNKEEFT